MTWSHTGRAVCVLALTGLLAAHPTGGGARAQSVSQTDQAQSAGRETSGAEGPVNAASGEAAGDSGSTVIDLPGITITAEKIARPFAETYSSVGLATQDDIETYNVIDLHDVFENMANVRAFAANNGNNAFQIRGLNADGVVQPGNSAPMISVVIDGVTQSAEGLKRGSRGTWDVGQIAVLRGPQSTLQGRNAMGGTVVIESNDPTWHTERAVRGAFGTQEFREGALMLSGPLVGDQVAGRFSGEFRREEKDVTFGDPLNEPLGEDKYHSFRGKLLIEPDSLPDLRIMLNASHTFDQPTAAPVTGPDFFARQFNNAATFNEFRQMSVQNLGADMAWSFGALTLRSKTAGNLTDLKIDTAPGNVGFFRDDNRQDTDLTQEVLLEINENASGLTGVAGVFFGTFNQETESFIDVGGVVFQNGTFRNETRTLAAFGDMRYEIFDGVSILGGLRVQSDKVRNFIDNASAFGNTLSDRQADYLVFLPKGGLSWEFVPGQSVAATATRGYRQGLTEVLAGTANTVHEVDPEFVWTYELAYRLETGDGRGSFGANLFYNQFTDQQLTVTSQVAAPLANTENLGESRSYGVELEGRYDFGSGFSGFGALGLLKTELGDFQDNACATSGGNCEGNEFPEAPNVTFAFGGVYRDPSGFFASASGSYTGSYFTQGDIDNRAQFKLDSFFVANLRLGWEGENMFGSVYVSNIFDEQYLTARSTNGNSAAIADGRTFGFRLGARF